MLEGKRGRSERLAVWTSPGLHEPSGTAHARDRQSRASRPLRPRRAGLLFENHEINSFDVSRHGQRFLVAEEPNPGAPPSLDLTVPWFVEVRCKLRGTKTP